jgi:hypothetical protein
VPFGPPKRYKKPKMGNKKEAPPVKVELPWSAFQAGLV